MKLNDAPLNRPLLYLRFNANALRLERMEDIMQLVFKSAC